MQIESDPIAALVFLALFFVSCYAFVWLCETIARVRREMRLRRLMRDCKRGRRIM